MATELSKMGLMQRLSTMSVNNNRISDDQFKELERAGSILGEDLMISLMTNIRALASKVNDLGAAVHSN